MVAARSAALDEVGSLDAEPGTRPWAIAVKSRMSAALKDERMSADHLKRWMDRFRQHEGYRVLANGDGEVFPTFEAFCRCPAPHGLGYDSDAIDAIISERKSAQARAQDPKDLPKQGEIGGGHTRNDVIKSDGGTSADYLTARIARDHPDILERMKAGEFRSVRAAAKAAGIVAERWSVPADPGSAGRYLASRLSPDEWSRLKAEGDRRFGGA